MRPVIVHAQADPLCGRLSHPGGSDAPLRPSLREGEHRVMLPDPYETRSLKARVSTGDAQYCTGCGVMEGLPHLAGRCPACDSRELRRNMPPDSRQALGLDLRTALGYTGAEETPYIEFISRDASYWDNRLYRGWEGFRVQLLTIIGPSILARPVGLTLTPDALPRDARGLRLIMEPTTLRHEPTIWTPDDLARQAKRIVVFRLRLWRIGGPGYLQGLWLGQEQRLRWDLCDVGAVTEADIPLWLVALAEHHHVKPGPKPHQQASRDDLIRAIRRAAIELRRDTLPLDQATIAGRLRLPGWASRQNDTGLSARQLRRLLKRHGLDFNGLIAPPDAP